MDYAGNVGFAIGTGRCGTLFLYELLGKEPEVASSHERNPENEAFQRYCKWHGLPIDDEGFLATKQQEITADLANRSYSFEASPYLSLSVRVLYERFNAKFILLVRCPDGVVTSFAHKGFYRKPYTVGDPELAAGYQDQSPERIYSFFARVSPRGDFLRLWNAMTQIGRIAWVWKAMNEHTLAALQELPSENYRIVRIDDLDYGKYLELSEFLGFRAQVMQADFDALKAKKPHAFWRKRHVDQWTDEEVRDFEAQVKDLAESLGYEYRVDRLISGARTERAESLRTGRIPQPNPPARFWRLRRATADLLRGMANAMERSQ